MNRLRIGAFLITIVLFGLLLQCDFSKKEIEEKLPYLNLADSVQYVGKEKCVQCHSNVMHTFEHTGMGQSFGKATQEKSAAIYHPQQSTVYDTALNFYYHAFWKNDSLYFKEFRLVGKDTVHQRIERIDYVIGSGQHTNSHLVNFNGFIYQAPITFYTQKGVWDMAPGFENGFNSRFTRYIGKECMTCHNALPEMVEGSLNKYKKIPLGIDCERCHGPGEIHVREKIAEKIVDTATTIDYTIVNPKDLPIDYQNSLCQRCHLQGVAVLKEGKDYDDFKPGMKLSAIMNVFLPQFEGGEQEMIMASHVERLKKSECFQSGKMSCITCHNPHVSVQATAKQKYSKACLQCHSSVVEVHQESLTYPTELADKELELADWNVGLGACEDCHMSKTGSIDIPHVAVTDHWIGHRKSKVESRKSKVFKGLLCVNNEAVEHLDQLKAYLAYYEKYEQKDYLLDSIEQLLTNEKHFASEIAYLFLKQDYAEIIALAEGIKDSVELDHWTNYKIGESYYQLKQYARAVKYLKTAIQLQNYHLDYHLKLGNAYVQLGNLDAAEKSYRFILSQQDKHSVAYSNLAFMLMLKGQFNLAEQFLKTSIQLDPDYRLSRENLINLYYQQGKQQLAIQVIEDYLKQHPNDLRMLSLKEKINGR